MLVIKAKVLNLYTAWHDETWLYCVIGLKTILEKSQKYAKTHNIKTINYYDINNHLTIINV